MGRKPISEEDKRDILRKFFRSIAQGPKTIEQISEELQIGEQKISGCIKWFRRECEFDMELLPFYPIATKHGYKKLKDATEDEIAKAYCAMYKSTISQQKTFTSVREYLLANQFLVSQWESECLDVIMNATNKNAYEVGSLIQEEEC